MDPFNLTVVTTKATNFTSSPRILPRPSWYSSHLFPAVMLSLCCILGVPGNIAVIVCRNNWKHLSSLSKSLMLNLAISDLICLLTLPLWIHTFLYSWTFSQVSCKLLASVVYSSTYCSLLTITGLSIQRYLMVVLQQRCQQVQNNLVLVLLWLVAFILSIRHVVVQQLVPNQQGTDCQAQYSSHAWRMASLVTEILLGLAFFSIVAFSYICIQRKINQSTFFSTRQATRLVTGVTVCFFVLWVPYQIINVLHVAAICLNHEHLLKFCMNNRKIVVALTFVNSCLNPLLYAFTSHKICTDCRKQELTQPNQRIPQTADLTVELSKMQQ